MPDLADARTAEQVALLQTKVGEPGSGAVRYAAAMYLYGQDQMPVQMLEVYRACSKFDREDPIFVATFEGVEIPEIARPCVNEDTV